MEPSIFTAELGAALLAAGFTGLASSLHCLGMCGGAMSAMMLTAVPRQEPELRSSIVVFPLASLMATVHAPSSTLSPSAMPGSSANQVLIAARQQLPLVCAFNAGRIFSYVAAGAAVGAFSSGMGAWLMRDAMPLRLSLFIVANLVMLMTGLYIAGWTRGLAPLERVGQYFWQKISPWATRLLPVKNAQQAAVLGALWGWIPCGLVYAMLVVALASGNAVSGAAIMLGFGLGTLPAMTAAGILSAQMKSWLRNRRLRVIAGIAVMVMALLGLNRAPLLAGLASHATLTELCHRVVLNIAGGSP